MPLQVSVSNLDLFRIWNEEEDLDLAWLLDRLYRKVERTEAMLVGEALHSALETACEGDCDRVNHSGYTFQFLCDIELYIPRHRELSVQKKYGEVEVRGRVDAITGKTVMDHKTTQQFDADRLMAGYQWRYYLDMMGADTFLWNVFVLKETDDPKEYIVSDFHSLKQNRYPDLHKDCVRLAEQYAEFAAEYLPVEVKR